VTWLPIDGKVSTAAGLERLPRPRHHRLMPRIAFTPQLRRFLAVPDVQSAATTLRAALDDAFALNPQLRGYVLDDQGHLRANVVVFVDGRRCRDRVALADALQPDTRVHVLQALSGG
jgi:sulfur-carrier protein